MYLKILGAILVISACGGYGLMMVFSHRKEVAGLRALVHALDVMICVLDFRLTPLPDLCKIGADSIDGPVSSCLLRLSEILNDQLSADVGSCTTDAVDMTAGLPQRVSLEIRSMGQTRGRFDLEGQRSGLRNCKEVCNNQLEVLEHQQPQRLRSYQTLGFCAGAALAILLF